MIEINKIICDDCFKIMKNIPDKSIDLILTDPPYGVNLKYENYKDTKENLKKLINKFIPEFFRISDNILFTPGNGNLYLYPEPSWIFIWANPAGNSITKYGFNCYQPILFYGDYHIIKKTFKRDLFIFNKKSEKNNHPCPKPIELWEYLLIAFSKENNLIFDPFIGSGTTAIACIKTGRQFIGIEKEKKYCDIAKIRIKKALREKQLQLFDPIESSKKLNKLL